MKTSTFDYEVESEVIVVKFAIPPIRDEFRGDLSATLLEDVWGNRGEVEEDIRVGCGSSLWPGVIDCVRYQFGNAYTASQDSDEIAVAIEHCFKKWCALNGGYDLVSPRSVEFPGETASIKSAVSGGHSE